MDDFNLNWEFYPCDLRKKKAKLKPVKVNLPHTVKELPLHYFDEKEYQFISTYRKIIQIKKEAGKRYLLDFEGIMADSWIYVNGKLQGEDKFAFVDFTLDITAAVKDGKNVIEVIVDSSENVNMPPFGGLIDYMTFGGIYLEAHFYVKNETYIKRAWAFFKPDGSLEFHAETSQPYNGPVAFEVADGKELKSYSFSSKEEGVYQAGSGEEFHKWSPSDPHLYKITCRLEGDEYSFSYGFRHLQIKDGLLRVNGQPVKLRGLDRHQSFPYVGYAGTKNMQKLDADILKNLGCNCVRTSHYPQSRHFLDECDRIGLLVLEEIPGWQHLGDQEWKEGAKGYVQKMIERDLNHPAIFLWGVRVNESVDEHALYTQTNAIAHKLDPYRFTCGIRYIYQSELLEDVFAFNDFSYAPEKPIDPLEKTTGLDHKVPYLITEFGGHIYPTDKLDDESRLQNQTLLHARVQHAAYLNKDIMGAIGWCAFDYNTHYQFGNGDRICRHGVMDFFRLPKMASYFYMGQKPREEGLVLEASTIWAFGERNYGGVCPLYIFTNCDTAILRFDGKPDIVLDKPDPEFAGLPHPIFKIEKMEGAWGGGWQGGKLIGLIDGIEVISKPFTASQLPTSLEAEISDKKIGLNDAVRVVVRLKDQVGNNLKYSSDILKIECQGQKVEGPKEVALYGGEYAFYIRTLKKGKARVKLSCLSFKKELSFEVIL
jgi:beta-galactosidase